MSANKIQYIELKQLLEREVPRDCGVKMHTVNMLSRVDLICCLLG